MARRNLFQPPPLPSASAPEPAPAESKPRFPNTGAMSGVKSTLKDLSSNAVREIAVETIEEGGPKDRLAFSDAVFQPGANHVLERSEGRMPQMFNVNFCQRKMTGR